MEILSDLTLDQLRNANLDQLRNAIQNKLASLTKKQLIILILKITDVDVDNLEIQDRPIEQYWPDGQIKERMTITKDVLGNVLFKEKMTVTYYDTKNRERDTMTFTKYDPQDRELSVRGIKHFPDGRQPIAFEGREYKENPK